ncbi:MAG: methyltransferase domain-containing protein [Gammaproteobacteria bacterium]|nr:methyltransferase domain-containing protein [Gammaproteobacteria bacterium]
MRKKLIPRWMLKALIQKFLAASKLVHTYHFLQRHLGRLPQFQPKTRIEYVAKLYVDVRPFIAIREASFVEIGTGWVPIVPIGLYLLGAESIDTYDLYRHVQKDMTLRCIQQYQSCLDELHRRSGVSREYIQSRYETLAQITDIDTLFKTCGIRYHAPHDFSKSSLATRSIDILYSNLVLEHVSIQALDDIHREALRVLKNEGLCWHNVDCTDHYSHDDPSVSPINFLKYGEKQWARWGQNGFVYQNRMRATQYDERFKGIGFDIINETKYISDEIRRALQNNSWRCRQITLKRGKSWPARAG